MKAKLVLISADADAKEFKLALPTKIGRGQEAKLKLVHPLVSRVHCEIYEQDDQLMVRDLASLNGTFVDDERVGDEMALPSGCRLTVGSAHFHVLYGADYDRPLPKKAAAKADAPTKIAEETIPMSPAASKPASADSDDPWTMEESSSPHEESHEDTRTLNFDFLSDDDEPPKPAPAPAPKAAAPAKPAAKQAAPAKPAAAAKPTAAPKPAAAKPANPSASAPARPPNPAELADDDEMASSAKPFAAKGRPPAKTAPAAPAPAAPSDDGDEMVVGPAEESGGEGGDADLDDFLKSIM